MYWTSWSAGDAAASAADAAGSADDAAATSCMVDAAGSADDATGSADAVGSADIVVDCSATSCMAVAAADHELVEPCQALFSIQTIHPLDTQNAISSCFHCQFACFFRFHSK